MLIDAKHAVRALTRDAGPVLVSVLSLSLGIAATAIMLSVIDAIDFRPLPFQDAWELVDIADVDRGSANPSRMVAPGVFADWKERTRSMAALGAASSVVASLQDHDEALDAARVSDDFFLTLKMQPALGRVLGAEDIKQHARVAVISYELWRSRFNGDRQVIGRAVPLSWAGEFRSVPAESYTIVGVLPRGVRYPLGTQVWIPASGGFGNSRRDRTLTVIGRLNRAVSLPAVQAEFDNISARLAAEFPNDYARRLASVSPLRDAMRAAVAQGGAAARVPLLAITSFVLVLAVLNVAGLFLARTVGQMRELQMRLALGAPHTTIATFLLAQSLTLSFVAGLIGVVMSQWVVDLVSARLQVAESGAALILDGRFLVFAILLSIVTATLVGLLSLWSITRLARRSVLGSVSARGTGTARTGRVQSSVVVGQVALAIVLLSGAALLAAEFVRLANSETGFDSERLLVASVPINMTGGPEAASAQAHQAERRIAALPGVSSVALGALPAEGYTYRLENGEVLESERTPMSYRVTPGYFATLGVPVNAGREFAASDVDGSVPVAIVNRLAARAWWPNQDPVGKTLFMARRDGIGEWVRIVGVVDNERVRRSLTWVVPPVIYRPFDQLTRERRLIEVFARTEHQPEAAFASVQGAFEAVYGGGGWRGERVAAMETVLGNTLAEQRFRASALGLVSAVALFLAAIGIYGIVTTMVAQRTTEIGVRLALGARPMQVLALVFRRPVGLALAGFALGAAGFVVVNRILQSLLLNATGFDVRMPLAAGLILTCAVLLACYFPARRAARIDPVRLLHDV